MPAALEWDKVTRIDPASLFECEKHQLDEVIDMFVLVIAITSHQYHQLTLQLRFQLSCPATKLVSSYKLSTVVWYYVFSPGYFHKERLLSC